MWPCVRLLFQNRGSGFMAVGTDNGLFELDATRTRSARMKLINAGTAAESFEDPETWRPVPTDYEGAGAPVRPRDVLDAYYTSAEYSMFSSTGVTPWDQVAVNSRAKPHAWELDRVLSSYIPFSARDADLSGFSHNNVLATRLDYHPSLSYYCSGDVNGNVLLWKDSEELVVAQYRCQNPPVSRGGFGSSGSNAYSAPEKISRVRFSPNGGSVLATDSRGAMYMWSAHRPQTPATPIQALDKRCWDAVFLNAGSVVAVGGSSTTTESEGEPLCVACVVRFAVHGLNCAADVVCRRHGGSQHVSERRQRRLTSQGRRCCQRNCQDLRCATHAS